MGVRKYFSRGGQRKHFAYPSQVADDAMQITFTKRFTLSTRQTKCPVLRQQIASLAAIAWCITTILTRVAESEVKYNMNEVWLSTTL